MAVKQEPRNGIWYDWDLGDTGWHTYMNANLKKLGTLLYLSAISRTISTPPGSPVDGDLYIVGPSATDAWAGYEDSLAVWIAADSDWTFYTPRQGYLCDIQEEDQIARWNGTAWVLIGSVGFVALSLAPDTVTTDGTTSLSGTTSNLYVTSSGGGVEMTANPQIATSGAVDGQLLMLTGTSDTDYIILHNGDGLHLTINSKARLGYGDSILLKYNDSLGLWLESSRNYTHSEKTWAFNSPAGSSGVNYYGGFYKFGSSDNVFNPSITFGTANAAYGARVFLVQAAGGGGGTDTVVRITGTSFEDGVRTASDTEDVVIDDAGAAGTFYQTEKEWVGQVTIEKISGPDLLCNYGYVVTWSNNYSNFRVTGIHASWVGGANDASPDIRLLHHKASGWTYNAGAEPTPPSAIASMATDYNTEIQVVNEEPGAWERSDLYTPIDGAEGEGVIVEVTTSANKVFESANFLMRIRTRN